MNLGSILGLGCLCRPFPAGPWAAQVLGREGHARLAETSPACLLKLEQDQHPAHL